MINPIIWTFVGLIVGWLESLLMPANRQKGAILNIASGIVGALIGGYLLSPLLGVATIDDGTFNLGSLAVALLGAVIVMTLVNWLRRGTVTGSG